jgi:hypothetical protein
LFHSPFKPGINSLADHTAFELSERASDLKHQAAGWRGRVDRLLIEIKIHAARLQRLYGAEQID